MNTVQLPKARKPLQGDSVPFNITSSGVVLIWSISEWWKAELTLEPPSSLEPGTQRSLKPAILIKVTLLHGCFSRFLNCTNGNNSRKSSHIYLPKTLRLATFWILTETKNDPQESRCQLTLKDWGLLNYYLSS